MVPRARQWGRISLGILRYRHIIVRYISFVKYGPGVRKGRRNMSDAPSQLTFDEFYEAVAPPLDKAQESRLDVVRQFLAARPSGDAESLLKRMAAEGFLLDTVPTQYGGHDESITYASRCLELVGAVDGSLGWLLEVQQGLHYLLPTLTNGDCARYFHDIAQGGALLAGSHNRTGLAVESAANGIVVSGVLQYCSGAPISRWISFNSAVPHPVQGVDHGCVIMVRGDSEGVAFEPAPYVHTMRDSLTGIVQLKEAFIPWQQIHWYTDLTDPANRPKNCRYYGVWQSALLQNAVFLGIARHAMSYAFDALREQGPLSSARQSSAAALIGAAANDLLRARSLYYHRVEALETAAIAGTDYRQGAFPGHRAVVSSVASLSYSTVSRLIELLSGPVLVSENPIETCWRDIQIARAARGSRQSVHEPAFGEFLLSTCQR